MTAVHPDVILVEDDACQVEVAARVFRREHLEGRVLILRDGESALGRLLEPRPLASMPSLILLDLHLPRVDGIVILRALRRDPRTRFVPIVVVSTSDRRADVAAAYAAGANSYVVKRDEEGRPGDQLIAVVRYWLHVNRVNS